MKVSFSIVSAAFCGPFGSLMAHKKFQSPSSFLSIRASRLYFDQKCWYLVPSPTQMSPLRSPSLAQDQLPWSPRQNRMTPFGHGKSFGTIFKNLRSTQRSRTWWRGCRRPKTISRSEIVILVLKMWVTCFLVFIPMFLGKRNHLGPFLQVLDWPEGQEQSGGAVGGQERLHGVKW